jgi:hypothetical protein
MADIREYTQNVAKQNTDILSRIRKIQEDVAGLTDSISGLANDIESNALAIEEIGEIIGGGE